MMVSNCPRCQIVLFAFMVSNCPTCHYGVKLSYESNCPRIPNSNHYKGESSCESHVVYNAQTQTRLILDISCIFISLELDWRFQQLENPFSSIVVLIEKLEKASSLAQAQEEQPVVLAFAFFALVTFFVSTFVKRKSPRSRLPWPALGRTGAGAATMVLGDRTEGRPQSLKVSPTTRNIPEGASLTHDEIFFTILVLSNQS